MSILHEIVERNGTRTIHDTRVSFKGFPGCCGIAMLRLEPLTQSTESLTPVVHEILEELESGRDWTYGSLCVIGMWYPEWAGGRRVETVAGLHIIVLENKYEDDE